MVENDQNEEEHIIKPKVLSGPTYDTQTGHLDDLLNEKLERAFHQQTLQVTLHDVAKIASEHDPIDLSHAATRLPPHARPVLYENLPDLPAKVIFMAHAGSNTRSIIFRTLNDGDIKTLIENMTPLEAVWILDDMSDRRYKRIIELLDPKIAHRIRALQKHDRESAGRLMNDEFFSFHLNTTIEDVAKKIRMNPGIELGGGVYVTNDYDELCGFVPERNLIINKPSQPIRQIMQPVLHSVKVETDRDEVVDIMERYDLSALPVIDDYLQLVGVIPFEAAAEAMKDILDDTIASIAGTAEDFDEHDPIIKRFFWRAPWLVVTLFAGLTTATSLTLFQGQEWFIFVPFFVPLIAGLSGNVGIQCSTLMVRNISSGDLTLRTRKEAVLKEIMIGLLIGLVFGILCGLVIFTLNQMGFDPIGPDAAFVPTPIAIAATVCMGLFCACTASTMLGSISPFVFSSVGIDPAVASGPIVTAFNDVMSAWIFIVIAWSTSLVFFGG